MTHSRAPLTISEILAATSGCLTANGFVEASNTNLKSIDKSRHRVFEDAYSIVAIVALDSWADIRDGWIEAQSSLVELMSDFVPRDTPKSWDGYLVLLTSGLVPSNDKPTLSNIRYDTGRVRKLVATGEQLKEVSDIETALLPLLPLAIEMSTTSTDGVLRRLPDLLANKALSRDAIQAVVDAHLIQEPLIEALHNALWRRK